MFNILWDTRGYFFWLLVVSVFVLLLERIWAWRREQRFLRPQLAQDLFWLFFNGHYAGILVAHVGAFCFAWAWPAIERVKAWQLLAEEPIWLQVVVYLVGKDYLEWAIHNLLHRVPWLWEIHKLHHSIEDMDWIGNFRFHWLEIAVYQGLTYLPLVALGVDSRIILWIAVVATLVGHLNHSNLDWTWGPLRYVVNSPRMHVWHHARTWPEHHPSGVNFGIVFSVWDWIFGTVWWPSAAESPRQQPPRLGFEDIETFPRGLAGRFVYPLVHWIRRAGGS